MEDLNEIDEIVVTGGRPLHGTVRIQGSKNTALPVMAAALLSSGTSVLRECPKITDVFLMEKILRELGAETWWEDHDLYLDCSHADGTVIPEYFSGKMRSSVILLGAMLGRNGKARTGYPGGCVIGKRPVDLHIQVLQKLGARIVENGNEIQATCGKLKGAEVIFPKSSVGATEQGILAAVLAEGKTVFTGCAREPEIMQAIQESGRRQIILAGAETHICLLQTAMDLKGQGYEVFVVSNASSSRDAVQNVMALQRMAHGGIDIVTSEMVIFEWLEKAGTDEFKQIVNKYIL